MTSASITEANPIFKMLDLASEVTEKVWFQTANSEYKPTKYFEKRTGRKAYESALDLREMTVLASQT